MTISLEPVDPVAAMESLALDAERQINVAERSLDRAEPEVAEADLARARPLVEDPRIDGYPDTIELRRRYQELVERVPAVREEIRLRALAERIDAARVRVETARAEVEAALAEIRAKHADESDFARANASIVALRAVLDEGAQLEIEDDEYEAYAMGIRKEEAVQREEIVAERRRIAVEDGRAALDQSLARVEENLERLSSGEPEDGDFDDARATVAALAKTLGDGAPLRELDAAYAAYAAKALARVESAGTAIEARRLAVEVARQTREIEVARSTLRDSTGRLEHGHPSDVEIETATTSLSRVEASLAAAGELEGRDAGFRRYVQEVKRSLRSANRSIEKGRLNLAVDRQAARLREALEAVSESTRGKSDLDVEGAKASIAALERTLAEGTALRRKDRRYAELSRRGERDLAGARARIKERQQALTAEAQQEKVKTQLEVVKEAVANLDLAAPEEDAFHAAFDALAGAKEALREGATIERKDAKYRAYAKNARALIKTARARIDGRRLELAARDLKTPVLEALAALKDFMREAEKPEATGEDVKKVSGVIQALREALAKGAHLEARHKAYAQLASSARKAVAKAKDDLEAARGKIAFRDGPIAALVEGRTAAESKGATPEVEKRDLLLAVEHFTRCRMDAASILASHPRFASTSFKVGKRRMRGGDVLSTCAKSVTALRDKIRVVNTALAFYSGPAKSFERGKEILDSAAGALPARKKIYRDALTHFEACLASGKSLDSRHPEFRRTRLELSGEKVTLPLVVAACERQAKSLRGSLASR